MIKRYSDSDFASSPFDPIVDLLNLFDYVSSTEYLRDTVFPQFSIANSDFKSRSKEVVAHARLGRAYLNQSLESDSDISFLLSYYGILQFVKVCCLLGSYHARVAVERWHGVSYLGNEKVSQSVLSEFIYLKGGGAIPLLYRTLTGVKMPVSKLKIGDLFSYISSVSVEYKLATGRYPRLAILKHEWEPTNRRDRSRSVLRLQRRPGDTSKYNVKNLKVLAGFKQDKQRKDIFLGKVFPKGIQPSEPTFRKQFRTYLIYKLQEDGSFRSPISSARFLLPEEIPLILIFFYMSSVVRYNPRFLSHLKDSKYWPLVCASRQHGLLRVLVLLWSFIHQHNLELSYGM